MEANTQEDAKHAFAQGNAQRAIVPYLEQKLADVKTQLVTCQKERVEWLQGRAQELSDLVKFAKQSVS